MAVLTEARLMGVTVGSAPEVVSEVVSITLAGPRDIGAGAVEALCWRAPTWKSDNGIHSFPFDDFTDCPGC